MKKNETKTTDYLVINRVAAMNFDKALHLSYQKRCYDFVAAVDKEKLRLSDDLLKRWKACIDVEVEINKANAASEHTEKLLELDGKRDNLVSGILGTAQSQLASPIAARGAAAKTVYFNLRMYHGIQSESYSAESAHIHGPIWVRPKLLSRRPTRCSNWCAARLRLPTSSPTRRAIARP